MRFNEAIATASCMFCQPTLFADFDKRDLEAKDAIKNLKLMKLDKKKDKSMKHLEKLVFAKSRYF